VNGLYFMLTLSPLLPTGQFCNVIIFYYFIVSLEQLLFSVIWSFHIFPILSFRIFPDTTGRQCHKHLINTGRQCHKHLIKTGRQCHKHLIKTGRLCRKHLIRTGRQCYLHLVKTGRPCYLHLVETGDSVTYI